MDNLIGKRLDGRYSIEGLVGVGGMANVYRGTDLKTGNQIAVKVLKEEFLDNEELVRRFKNESKAISILSHPNIVKVYDVSVTDKLQYIVMEYVDGITLKEYLKQRGGALTLEGNRAFCHTGAERPAACTLQGHHPPRCQAAEYHAAGGRLH